MTPQELAAKTGEVIGVSDWFEVSQERINKFAEATGDFQFIHIDEEKAKLTPFGGTIAHGFLTLSLLPVLGSMTDGARIGADEVHLARKDRAISAPPEIMRHSGSSGRQFGGVVICAYSRDYAANRRLQ